jgi:pectin methylesterase-like acyl-CoA thioesterase
MGLQETLFGRAALGHPAAFGGRTLYVDGTNGADGNTGLDPSKPLATLARALALCSGDAHEAIIMMPGTYTLSAAEDFNLDHTHLIGAGPLLRQGHAVEITASGSDATFFTISASNALISNLTISHGVAATAANVCALVSGDNVECRNVHFNGIGHATGQGDETDARSLQVSGDYCIFQDCVIGRDDIARSVANAELELSGAAKNPLFRDCLFLANADNNGHLFVIVGASGISGIALFDRCVFFNDDTSMTEWGAINDAPGGKLLLKDCTLWGAGDWEAATESGDTIIDGASPTANASGLAVAVAAT